MAVWSGSTECILLLLWIWGHANFHFGKSTDLPEKDIIEINEIVEKKRSSFPWDLVNETHKLGGAWDQIYANGKGNHQEIPVDLIRKVG